MTFPGPSRTIEVIPEEQPAPEHLPDEAPEPQREPAPRTDAPERDPEKIPA